MPDGVALVICQIGLFEEYGDVVPDDVRKVLGVDDPLGPDLGDDEVQLILVVHPGRGRPHLAAVVRAGRALQTD
jgi:hypothetical protein